MYAHVVRPDMTEQRPYTGGSRKRSSRRRVLARLSVVVGVPAVAGCGDLRGGNEPSYEAGAVGEIEGDERTPAEMTAAEALAERTVNEGVTPLETLSIRDHAFVLEDDFRGPTVQGIVVNTGDDRIQVAEVRVRAYDDENTHLGRYVTSTGDLDGGSAWGFEVIVLEAPSDIDSYELAALGIPT